MSSLPEHTVVAIQARMGSKRFPGKSLALLAGKPSLEHLIDGLRQAVSRDAIYVLTSMNSEDNAIVSFCEERGIQVRRGDPENVASRFVSLIQEVRPEQIVRINGDSPLLDYRIVVSAIDTLVDSKGDLATTALPPAFPSGMNVEVVRAATYFKYYPAFTEPEHFEHVTKYLYELSERIKIVPIPCTILNARRHKFSFDDEEDKDRLERLFQRMIKPHYEYSLAEKCELMANF